MLRYRFVTVGLLAASLGLSPRLFAEPVITASGDVPQSEMDAGGKLYEQHCAECHDHPTGRRPLGQRAGMRAALRRMAIASAVAEQPNDA